MAITTTEIDDLARIIASIGGIKERSHLVALILQWLKKHAPAGFKPSEFVRRRAQSSPWKGAPVMTRKARKVDGTRISAAWRKIIAALARYQSFTRADLATVAKRHGRPFGFGRFKRAGIFKRVGPGTYRVAGAKPVAAPPVEQGGAS